MRIPCLLLVCLTALLASCRKVSDSESSTAPKRTSQTALNDPADTTEKLDARPRETQVPQLQLNRDDVQAGWIQLFDGQSLFGWKANNDVNWSVSQGVIQADSGEPGLLLTTVPFADFELRCDFRLEKGGNSGIFLRTAFAPKDPTQDCYELNICDSHPAFPTGSIVGRKKVEQPVVGEVEWKTYWVRVEGSKITVKLDEKLVMEFSDNETQSPRLKSGFIGLQKNEGKVEFRNIALRPLRTKLLFSGKDLNGWRTVPGSKSEFTVVDDTIHVANGPGFLETDGIWDNFILQFDAKTNGRHLNSGVFFRAMPGTEEAPSNGYEFQIHNGFEKDDRSKPMDAGTGAIFRFTKARWVVANDEEWFTATLIANGPHFATWVNGLQVSDWTDERKRHENPRRGLRQQAGHISLQGHDPKTDLQFRKLRLAPLPQ